MKQKAIHYLLSGEKKKKQKVISFKNYLQCLSALEFETFIAKLYEEKGYHVPAYKGGTMKDYDLLCKNKKDGKVTPLQIKLYLEKGHYDKTKKDLTYYCISSDVREKNVKTCVDIERELADCSNTKEWLEQTLFWVRQGT